ncbi:uncharacterized protein LOC143034409 isoform X3 [Oratosquilla oratoria]|uniref:uncharacterized protein LOC143034409 isoform X3 n=1 Tax=Oratosquilla oratoria TaxID=337810 RepID=UPI003F7718DC
MGGVKKSTLQQRKKAEFARKCKKALREDISITRPGSSSTISAETPTSSATKRKLAISHSSNTEKKRVVEDENIIFRKSYLQEVFSKVVCSECFGKLNLSFHNKYMDYKIDLQCQDCKKRLIDSQDEAGVSRAGADGVIGLGDCEPQVYVDVAEDPEDSIRGKHAMSDTEEHSASDRRKYIKIEDDTDVKIDISKEHIYVETNEEFILPNRNEPMDTNFYIKQEPDDSGRVKQEPDDSGRVKQEPDDSGRVKQEPDDSGRVKQEPDDSGRVKQEPDDSGRLYIKQEPGDSGTV